MFVWLAMALTATLTGLLVTWAMIRWPVHDHPDEARKLHVIPTPSAGGVGIVAGVLAGIALGLSLDRADWEANLALCVAIPLAGGILGLIDDIKPVSARVKLALLIALAGLFALLGPRLTDFELVNDGRLQLATWVSIAGVMLWLVVIANVVNFIDGANGLAMGCSMIAFCGLAALSHQAGSAGPMVLAVSGACACLGFLRWNGLAGAIFAGDVGALFVGLLIGTTGLWAAVTGVQPLAVALCVLPMLTDTLLTIIWRLRHGHDVLKPHDTHLYQLRIRAGARHGRVALDYSMRTALCVALAFYGQSHGASFTLMAVVMGVGLGVVEQSLRRKRVINPAT